DARSRCAPRVARKGDLARDVLDLVLAQGGAERGRDDTGRELEQVARDRAFEGQLGVERATLFPIEEESGLLGCDVAGEEVRIEPRDVDALLARHRCHRADSGRGLEVAYVVGVLEDLLGAVATDAAAVLGVSLPPPARIATEAAAQACDTAIVVDLLAGVRVIGDRRRADVVDSRPAGAPVVVAVGRAGAIEVAGVAEGPELAPTVLVGLAAVVEELAEQLDRVGDFERGFGIDRVEI